MNKLDKILVEENDKIDFLKKNKDFEDKLLIYNNFQKYKNLEKQDCELTLGYNLTNGITELKGVLNIYKYIKDKNNKFKLYLRNDSNINEDNQIFKELAIFNDKNVFIEKDISLEKWLPKIGLYLSFSESEKSLKLLKYALSSGCLPYTDKFKKEIPFNFMSSMTLWNDIDSEKCKSYIVEKYIPNIDIYNLINTKEKEKKILEEKRN